jgi:excisionase family DNA binding protein
MFRVKQLELIHYYVRVADSVLPADHKSRDGLDEVRDDVEVQIARSRARTENDAALREFEVDDKITTAEAARLMDCSQRWVQYKIKRGELRAETFGRSYVLNRRDIA